MTDEVQHIARAFPDAPLIEQLTRERDEARAEVERLRAVIRWLHGVEGPFPIRGEGEGAYWWRKELRRRVAGMVDLEAKEAAEIAADAKSEVERLRNALAEARSCLADMHDSEDCKFVDPNADGCLACWAFEQIANAEEGEAKEAADG